jgi:hypothetical protein
MIAPPRERSVMDTERDREEWTDEDERHPGGAEEPMPVQEEGLAVGLEGQDGFDADLDPEIAEEWTREETREAEETGEVRRGRGTSRDEDEEGLRPLAGSGLNRVRRKPAIRQSPRLSQTARDAARSHSATSWPGAVRDAGRPLGGAHPAYMNEGAPAHSGDPRDPPLQPQPPRDLAEGSDLREHPACSPGPLRLRRRRPRRVG